MIDRDGRDSASEGASSSLISLLIELVYSDFLSANLLDFCFFLSENLLILISSFLLMMVIIIVSVFFLGFLLCFLFLFLFSEVD